MAYPRESRWIRRPVAPDLRMPWLDVSTPAIRGRGVDPPLIADTSRPCAGNGLGPVGGIQLREDRGDVVAYCLGVQAQFRDARRLLFGWPCGAVTGNFHRGGPHSPHAHAGGVGPSGASSDRRGHPVASPDAGPRASSPAAGLFRPSVGGFDSSSHRACGAGVPGAPLSGRDAGLDLGDVLAAAGPGGLAAGLARDGSAHGGVSFGSGGVRSVVGEADVGQDAGQPGRGSTRRPCRSGAAARAAARGAPGRRRGGRRRRARCPSPWAAAGRTGRR